MRQQGTAGPRFMKRQGLSKIFLLMLLVAMLAGTVLAQAPPPSPNAPATGMQQGLPERVAHLQYMSGKVSVQPGGGADEWAAATLNWPLGSSDRVWVDKGSRAELSLGTAAIHMSSETGLTLTGVSDNSVQLELAQGTLSVSVYQFLDGEVYEVDTPNLAFTIMKPGEYRFDLRPDSGQTVVTVRKGNGQATGQGKPVRVKEGEQATFTNGTSLTHTQKSAPKRDGFDTWVKFRNHLLQP